MKRAITPTARKQLKWIEDTYAIGSLVDDWCNEIVAHAGSRARPRTEVSLIEVLEELEELAQNCQSDWRLSGQRFRQANWLVKLRAIREMIAHVQPPNRIRVNARVFQGLSDRRLPVEVKTVYEIDLGRSMVIFNAFASYSTDEQDVAHDQAQSW